MASPLTSPPAYGEHQIEAVQKLLVFMEPESIKGYAKALDALGKQELAYRLKAIKDLPQEVLAMVIRAAQARDSKQILPPPPPQAQPAEARSLKRPRPDTDANEITDPKPAWQLNLPYFIGCCNKSHKCTEVWSREKNFRNHFSNHLLDSTTFKAQDGSTDWACCPETCEKTFADAAKFMAHIWKDHMRPVARQLPGPSQTLTGASGYSPASYSAPYTPGDDPVFSPHYPVFSPPPSMPPSAVAPNATSSHASPYVTPASTQPSIDARSSVPFSMQPTAVYPSNGYSQFMYGNNTTNRNMLHGMPQSNVPYNLNSHTVLPHNNATHSNVVQNMVHNNMTPNMARPLAQNNMTGWPDQSLSAPFSSSTAAGQPYPQNSNHDFNNFNSDPRLEWPQERTCYSFIMFTSSCKRGSTTTLGHLAWAEYALTPFSFRALRYFLIVGGL